MEVGQGPEFATLEGEQLVRDQGITALPVDPRAIAKEAGIAVYEKPAEPGVSGMLIRVGNDFAIAYSTLVASEGFRRFSLGHELGHCRHRRSWGPLSAGSPGTRSPPGGARTDHPVRRVRRGRARLGAGGVQRVGAVSGLRIAKSLSVEQEEL